MSLFSLVSVLIGLAAMASYVNYRYIKLPTAIGVTLIALGLSLGLVLAGPHAGDLRELAENMVRQIDFDKLVLHGLLAFLLFAGAIHVKLDELAREWLPVSLLAVLGTLFSTCVVGGATWLVLDWLDLGIPLLHALLFGAIVAPTDPIAVIGIMKSAGASRQLEVQISGESLFNDGLAVVVFLVLVQLAGLGAPEGSEAAVPHAIDMASVGWLLLKEVGGALALGLAAGFLAYQMLKRVNDYQVEVLLTLALAMGVYALAEFLHLSAPIAVVVAGLLVGNHGREFAMTKKTRHYVDAFWGLIDEIVNVVLFLLLGLELLVLPIESRWLVAGMLVIPIVLAARCLSVAGIIGPLGWARPQSKGAISILTWGGLHGAISVALALSLPDNDSRSLLLTLTYAVVVFSILVQGLTIGPLIRRFGKAATRTG